MATDNLNEADDDLAPMPLGMRRNTWSFENRWAAKFHQTEAMDYGDDHETWSVGSADSDKGFPRRSSLKDLTKLADTALSLEHTSSPQFSPGPTRRSINSPGLVKMEIGGSEYKEPSGVPNSTILNWLSFRKYVQQNTIAETSESPKDSPVDEDGPDSAITAMSGSGPASPLPGPAINLSGKLLEAAAPFKPNAPLAPAPAKKQGMRRNFSLNEVGAAAQENVGMRRNFSFKELNAVAPSGW